MAIKKSKTSPPVKKTGGRSINNNNNSNPSESRTQYTSSFMGAGAVAVLAIAVFYAYAPLTHEGPLQQSTAKEVFLKWFVDNGGIFYPIDLGNNVSANVTIEEFPAYGGWGLALNIPPTGDSSCQSDAADEQCSIQNQTSLAIRRLDPLFTVPSSIIISVESVLNIYASPSSPLYVPDFDRVNTILSRAFPQGPGLARRGMGLVEQDVVIAMYLLVEDCQHRNPRLFTNDGGSRWGPYLEVLPQYTIPRLDTFGDEEYAALRDENLEHAGRTSRKTLEGIYYGGGARVDGLSLKTVMRDMIRTKSGPASPISEACISFDTFHRFVAIVSSRAMLIQGGVKHLTPLAEMINYSPRVAGHDFVQAPFDLYHSLSADKSITVSSDRDVFFTRTSNEPGRIQLFEDYGPVDNSLFIEAHGFVPDENPNNCAVISGKYFLQPNSATGAFDDTLDLVLRALQMLHLIHPSLRKFDALEDVCVTADLRIVEDSPSAPSTEDDTVDRQPASESIAITLLLLGNGSGLVWDRIENEYGKPLAVLREDCIAAIRSGDAKQVETRCARYSGSENIVSQVLRTAARRSIKNSEDEGDTESELVSLLQYAESQARDRLAVALQFRLKERKLLSEIANHELK